MWIPSWITLLWTPCTFIPSEITPLLTVQSIFRLNSGYSRIPIHAQGEPLAFRGLLLVKKVFFFSQRCRVLGLTHDLHCYSSSRTTPQKRSPCPISNSRSGQKHIHPSIASRHWITCTYAPLRPYQKSNWLCTLIASEPNARACRWRYWLDHPRR